MSSPNRQEDKSQSLVRVMAQQAMMEPAKYYATLKATAFKDAKSDEQFAAMLMVAHQHKLNPMTREIYAFPAQGGGVVPVVGFDGWSTIANRHPEFDGYDLVYAENKVKVDGCHFQVPEYVEAIIYRKDRSHAATARCYFAQAFRKTPAWTSSPIRMMEQKALAQGYRRAFGYSGLYEPDEAERMAEVEQEPQAPAASKSEAAKEALRRNRRKPEPEPVEDAVVVDEETGEIVGEESDLEALAAATFKAMTSDEVVEQATEAAVAGTDVHALIRDAESKLDATLEEMSGPAKRQQPRKAEQQKESLL